MAIVVEHLESAQQFVVVGAGYGMFESSRPGVFGGSLFPSDSQGSQSLLAVCDAAGEIRWFHSHELRVVTVDGVPVSDVVGLPESETAPATGERVCPACRTANGAQLTRCSSCGLRLVDS